MASVRATVDPLACAESADALADAVRALRVGDSLGATPVALYHDCVARHPARVPSPELYDAVSDAMASWGGGFKHGVYARFKNPNDPESKRGARETLRFCVAETSAGYVFGLCTYAPPRFHAKTDWSRKPNNYSAGTQPSIAAVAVNAVFAPGVFGGDGECEPGDGEPWARARARRGSRPVLRRRDHPARGVVARVPSVGRGHKRAERAERQREPGVLPPGHACAARVARRVRRGDAVRAGGVSR
jgi:hypothetical protein